MPKKTSKKIPNSASVVRTYEEFLSEVDAFAHGERNLLIVVGPPGTSKSTAVRNRLTNPRIVEGGSTPYNLYIDLYKNKNLPIVLDDADKVFRTKGGVYLLKLLTQTVKVKKIQWNSQTADIRNGDLPPEFQTTSSTLIIANSWPRENPDIEAIESRGHLLYFAPSNAEIHRYAGTFFDDEEVYDYIGEHLALFDQLDLRLYRKAFERKMTAQRTGDCDAWKKYVQSLVMGPEKRTALDLLRDKSFASDHQRSLEFRRLTGKSDRCFYRYKDEIELRQGGDVKPVGVSNRQTALTV